MGFGPRDHGSGEAKQKSSAAEDPPLSRDTPVLLFDGHDGSTSDECGVDINGVLFDDHAARGVEEDYLSPYEVRIWCMVWCMIL